MADRISIDTELLEDLSRQIQQLQRSLNTVNGDMTRSISEVQRVAGEQDGIIRKMQGIQKNIRRTADRSEKLAKAVCSAANCWEETEKRIARQKISGQSSDIGPGEAQLPATSGGGGGASSGKQEKQDWLPGWLKKQLRETPLAPVIWSGDFINIMLHVLNGEDYSSGSVREFGWKYNGKIEAGGKGWGIYADTQGEFSVWDNDLISVTWQETELFGRKMRVPLPYINMGTGISGNPVSVGAGADGDRQGVHVDTSIADGYAGKKFEIGFKDGDFVFHIGGGASISAFSSGVQKKNKYVSIGTSVDAGSAGAVGMLDYRDGVVSGSVSISYIEGADLSFSFNAAEWVKDFESAVDDFTHGDFLSGIEKASDLMIFSY